MGISSDIRHQFSHTKELTQERYFSCEGMRIKRMKKMQKKKSFYALHLLI